MPGERIPDEVLCAAGQGSFPKSDEPGDGAPVTPPTPDIQTGIADHGAIAIQARGSFESRAMK